MHLLYISNEKGTPTWMCIQVYTVVKKITCITTSDSIYVANAIKMETKLSLYRYDANFIEVAMILS